MFVLMPAQVLVLVLEAGLLVLVLESQVLDDNTAFSPQNLIHGSPKDLQRIPHIPDTYSPKFSP